MVLGGFQRARCPGFAKRLDALIGSKGLTNSDVGRAVGVNHNTVAAYRTGRNEPGVGRLYLLCQYLRVSCDELLGIKAHDGSSPWEISEKLEVIILAAAQINALLLQDTTSDLKAAYRGRRGGPNSRRKQVRASPAVRRPRVTGA